MSDTRPQARSPFISLMGLLIAGFLGLFSEAALNIALPDLMEVFSVSAAIVQWLTTAYLLAVGVVLPLFGLVSRWLSTRQLAVIANAAFILGAVVCALSADFGMLILGRVLQGIATGIMLPLLFSAAISVYPLAQRGKALGMIGLVVMFAPAVSPVVAGLILEVATWEWIFWVTVPVMAAALVLSLAKLPNVRELSRPHIDMLSIVSSVIGFGGLVLGVSVGGEQGWTSPVVAISLLVGLLSLAVFVRRQLRSAQPFLEMRAFTSRAFSTGAIVIGLLSAVLMCTIFLIPMYLQDARLMSVLAAAFIMLPGAGERAARGASGVCGGREHDLLHRAADRRRDWYGGRREPAQRRPGGPGRGCGGRYRNGNAPRVYRRHRDGGYRGYRGPLAAAPHLRALTYATAGCVRVRARASSPHAQLTVSEQANAINGMRQPTASPMTPTAVGPTAASRYPIPCEIAETRGSNSRGAEREIATRAEANTAPWAIPRATTAAQRMPCAWAAIPSRPAAYSA